MSDRPGEDRDALAERLPSLVALPFDGGRRICALAHTGVSALQFSRASMVRRTPRRVLDPTGRETIMHKKRLPLGAFSLFLILSACASDDVSQVGPHVRPSPQMVMHRCLAAVAASRASQSAGAAAGAARNRWREQRRGAPRRQPLTRAACGTKRAKCLRNPARSAANAMLSVA